ncbi:LacI family transcriptional regulator [Nonomuraea sp. MG754425]|nr:LacI family transcriptional regulator [Nonomuraea sp. MG754425]
MRPAGAVPWFQAAGRVLCTPCARGRHAYVAQGVQAQAAAEGRLCVVGVTGGDPERELATVRLARREHAACVIIAGAAVDRGSGYAHVLAAAGLRPVLCGHPPPGPGLPALTVGYDDAGGAYAITSHLLSAGHRRILFLGQGPGDRLAGYRAALAAFRTPHDPRLEVEGAMERKDGHRMIRDRLAAGPPDFTAVLAGNDLVAAGARQALREHGLRVPGDISLAGFGDLPPSADIDLTTVHVPYEELGRTAVRLALRRGQDRTSAAGHVLLGTHIVVRGSVRPLPGSGAPAVAPRRGPG